ncbi:MAG: hypothetical protein ACXWUG_07240 [Polyangiales bacterium]
MTRERLVERIAALMKHGGGPIAILHGGRITGLRIVPLRTSGSRRPDGLRDSAPKNPGFGSAVTEVALEVDTSRLSRAQLAAVHAVLSRAGTDDWMNYSHLDAHDPALVPNNATLGLTFSSEHKGADVLTDVISALEIPLAEVTTS